MRKYNYTFDIVGGVSKSEYPEFNPSETVNMFVVMDQQGRNGKALYPTPGLSLENGLDLNINGAGRRLYKFKDELFAVIRNEVYRIDSTFSTTKIGEIGSTEGYVGISNNPTQVMFVDGTGGWIYSDATKDFTKITSSGFPALPTDVSILGNRFVVNKGGTKETFYSEIGDGTLWNANNFFSLQSYTDEIVGYRTLNGRLYVFGTTTTEIFNFVGSLFPFQPQLPAFEFGNIAPGSIVEEFGMIAWLSNTDAGVGSILVTTGGMPQKISNDAIEREFETYTDITDASSYMYKNELGHIMYVINFTKANRTWMYDFNTRTWVRLEREGQDRHLGNSYAYFKGKHYVLDYIDGKIYDMSINYYDDAGLAIRRSRTSTIFNFTDPVVLGYLKLDLKQGTGLVSGNDSDPLVRLRMSYDGGNTFGNWVATPVGKIGELMYESVFDRLGRSDNFVFQVEHYNRVPFVLLGMRAQIEKELSA